MSWAGRWKNGTAVCLASGPSLTAEDAALAIAWRDAAPGRYAICANTTFRLVPTADAVFAHDYRWWKIYITEVEQTFTGARVSGSAMLKGWNVTTLPRLTFKTFGNSGAAAVSLAILAGCKRVILLGYDCQRGPKGEVHHHGDHPKTLGNAYSIVRWPRQFMDLANYAAARGVEVINCSRRTALTCFPKMPLEALIDHTDPALLSGASDVAAAAGGHR